MRYAVAGLAVLVMAVPFLLSGAPLLVPLVIAGVAVFVAAPIFLVARLSRERRKEDERKRADRDCAVHD